MLVVADPLQTIYEMDWQAPEELPRLTLPLNLRNTREVARVVRELGGAEVNTMNPKGVPIRFAEASLDDLVEVVRGQIEHAMATLGVVPSQIAVIVRHRSLQRVFLETGSEPYSFVEWEQRSEDAVLCETIHRTKGLERRAIVVVDLDQEQDPTLKYVAWSRSTMFLAVIGPVAQG